MGCKIKGKEGVTSIFNIRFYESSWGQAKAKVVEIEDIATDVRRKTKKGIWGSHVWKQEGTIGVKQISRT